MNAYLAKPTTGELADALRVCALGSLRNVAAVELLIAHRHWLRREPFLRRVEWIPADDVYPEGALPDWSKLKTMLDVDQDHELYDTGSERGVLAVAVSIVSGFLGDALTSCDTTNVDLIVEAVRYAGGNH